MREKTLTSSSQSEQPALTVNGFNSTSGGGLRILTGLVRFLGSLPKDVFPEPPIVLLSPQHDACLIDEARRLGLEVRVYVVTGFKAIDQILLYFVHLPLRTFFARGPECLLNLGDFIVPFVQRQVYYFDWLYAVSDNKDVWGQMAGLKRIARGIKWANIRGLINTPRVVIVQSEFVSRQLSLISSGPTPIVIPCPVDVFRATSVVAPHGTPIEKVSRYPQFLCLSSFATHKNIKVLLSVGELLKLRGLGVRIILTLDETDRAVSSFMRCVSDRGLGDLIINVGVLNFAEVDNWLEVCDALLLPTKLESFGMPYVESLARGRPILTSDLPFAREICKTGTMFFAPDDPIDIVKKIEAFIEHDGLEIDKSVVEKIVEDCNPSKVFTHLLKQTRF